MVGRRAKLSKPIAVVVGLVVYEWNDLHEKLARLFALIREGDKRGDVSQSGTRFGVTRDSAKSSEAPLPKRRLARWKKSPRALDDLKWLLDGIDKGCGAKIGSKAYLTAQQLCDESDRHVKRGLTFQGQSFRPRDRIVFCVRWHLRYKLKFSEYLCRDDGRTRALSGAHHDHALDPTLCPGIRKSAGTATLARLVCVLACRRNLPQNQRTLNLISIARSTKREENRRFPAARQAGESQPPRRSSGELSAPRADCSIRSRSMAIRPLIARLKRVSANMIQKEINARSGSSKYLNNLIEQDHGSIKLRLGPMLGLPCVFV